VRSIDPSLAKPWRIWRGCSHENLVSRICLLVLLLLQTPKETCTVSNMKFSSADQYVYMTRLIMYICMYISRPIIYMCVYIYIQYIRRVLLRNIVSYNHSHTHTRISHTCTCAYVHTRTQTNTYTQYRNLSWWSEYEFYSDHPNKPLLRWGGEQVHGLSMINSEICRDLLTITTNFWNLSWWSEHTETVNLLIFFFWLRFH